MIYNYLSPSLIYFRKITKDIIPDIKDYYTITTFGEIYSEYRSNDEKKLVLNKDSYGYLVVSLATDSGKRNFKVHRLVLMTFRPCINQDSLQVNHKDGDKTNNSLYNLEWCTAKENTIHAYNTGLAKIGEDMSFSILTNEQVRLICDCLSKGMWIKEIQNIFNTLSYTIPTNFRTIVNDIYHRKVWKHISKDFIFPEIEYQRRLTESQVHFICKELENGMLNYNTILEKMGYNLNNFTENEIKNLRIRIHHIYKRINYTEISYLYSF